MQNIKKNKVLIILLTAIFTAMLVCGLSLTSTKKAYAAEIDYVNQNYTNISSGLDFRDEGIIYKIHCPDVREILGIEEGEIDDYVTVVSFKAAMGCQIYFVNGVPCALEDNDYGDYQTSIYKDYYEILHYDDANKNVYIKFKNVSQLSYPEDLSIWSGDMVNKTQYIYLSNIQEPVTEVTAEDVFFSTNVVAAHGGKGWTDYNIYSIEFTIKLNQKVSHLVDSVLVYFIEGNQAFTMNQVLYTMSDGVGENGYINFEVPVFGDISDITERVKLGAEINCGEDYFTIESKATDLVTLWTTLVNNNFSGYNYETYMTDSNKEHIRKLVSSYNAGFFAEIKGSQNYFADYNANTDIKLTSLIFKIPISNLSSASFGWNSSYWQGYVYSVYVRIDKNLKLSASAFAMRANEDGSITASGDIEYNDSVATKIYNSVDYFAYNGYLYLRIKDDSPIQTYFPQRAERSFSAKATSTSYSELTMQVNTATIIYDDYNNELLAQIATLNAQLSEIQSLLESANALTESQRELINSLQSSLDNLQHDYEGALAQLEYMTEQIEVMREEYQKKIDQLIAENGNNNNNEPPKEEEKPIEEQTGLTTEQIIGLCAGIVFFMAIVTLLIPKRRR